MEANISLSLLPGLRKCDQCLILLLATLSSSGGQNALKIRAEIIPSSLKWLVLGILLQHQEK